MRKRLPRASRASAEFVVTGDVEGTPYSDVSQLRSSRDGRHVIYSAKRLGRYVVVVDGVESPAYDEILSFPSGDDMPTTSLGMLARRGHVDLRIARQWSK